MIIGTLLHACITREEIVRQAKIAFFRTPPKREVTLGIVLKVRAKAETAAKAATKAKAKVNTKVRKEQGQKK